MSRREGFLDRWSRMKQADDLPPEEPEVEPPAPVEDERPDEEILEELGLTHPDELKPGDDFSGFMAQAVPDRLRRMALRQLWRSNPVLANVDGLVEYGEDYTDSAMVVENLQTLYQVGKGMFVEEIKAEPEAESVEAPKDVDEADDPPTLTQQEGPDLAEAIVTEDEPELVEADPTPQPTRRRMRFS